MSRSVEKQGLVGDPDRFGLIQRGDLFDPNAGLFAQMPQRPPDIVLTVVQIGTQPNVGIGDGRRPPSVAGEFHLNEIQLSGDRWARLAYPDGQSLGPVPAGDRLEDGPGQGLEKPELRLRDDLFHQIIQLGVINRLGEIVAGGSPAQIEPHLDVHLKRLAQFPFGGQLAVMSKKGHIL
jgi:hypothetical protein